MEHITSPDPQITSAPENTPADTLISSKTGRESETTYSYYSDRKIAV